MANLTQREYWEDGYRIQLLNHGQGAVVFSRKHGKLIRKLLGANSYLRSYSYHDYLLWNNYLKRYLQPNKNAKIIEIGSAPGVFLVRAKQQLGLEPYGVEYSYHGAELNRRLFAEHNINPDNVIHGDFLDEAFQSEYKEHFDVVYSRGLIEHFTDVETVVKKHVNLLRKGGRLFVSIPNYGGFYYIWEWLFDREHLQTHNLSIMTKSKFEQLFEQDDLSPLFCGYYGTFTFRLLRARRKGFLRFLTYLCHHVADPVLSVVFRTLLGNRGFESSFFSPNLLFVGVKK